MDLKNGMPYGELIRTHRWVLAELGKLSEDTICLTQKLVIDRIAKVMHVDFYATEKSLPDLEKLGNRKVNAIVDLIDGVGEVIMSYFVDGLRAQRMEIDLDYTKSDIAIYEVDFTFDRISSI